MCPSAHRSGTVAVGGKLQTPANGTDDHIEGVPHMVGSMAAKSSGNSMVLQNLLRVGKTPLEVPCTIPELANTFWSCCHAHTCTQLVANKVDTDHGDYKALCIHADMAERSYTPFHIACDLALCTRCRDPNIDDHTRASMHRSLDTRSSFQDYHRRKRDGGCDRKVMS